MPFASAYRIAGLVSHRRDHERLIGADVFHSAPEVADDRQADDLVVVLGLDQDPLVLVADDGVDLVPDAGGAAQSQVVPASSPGEHTERDRDEPLGLGPILELLLGDKPVIDAVDPRAHPSNGTTVPDWTHTRVRPELWTSVVPAHLLRHRPDAPSRPNE